jgi:hypothetical protein
MKEIICSVCKKESKISNNSLSSRCNECKEIFMTKTVSTRIYNDKTIVKYSCCDCNKELKRYKDILVYNKRCRKCTKDYDRLHSNKINKEHIELRKEIQIEETENIIKGYEKSNNNIWNMITKKKSYMTKKQKESIIEMKVKNIITEQIKETKDI